MKTIVDRLEQYRTERGISTKKEMAQRLGVTEREYNFVESRSEWSRNPTKNFLKKLEEYTGKSAAYWVYGTEEKVVIENREVFKSTHTTVEEFINSGYITGIDFSKDVEEAIMLAVKADIIHLLLKKKATD